MDLPLDPAVIGVIATGSILAMVVTVTTCCLYNKCCRDGKCIICSIYYQPDSDLQMRQLQKTELKLLMVKVMNLL